MMRCSEPLGTRSCTVTWWCLLFHCQGQSSLCKARVSQWLCGTELEQYCNVFLCQSNIKVKYLLDQYHKLPIIKSVSRACYITYSSSSTHLGTSATPMCPTHYVCFKASIDDDLTALRNISESTLYRCVCTVLSTVCVQVLMFASLN